jgi:hypothetical protein
VTKHALPITAIQNVNGVVLKDASTLWDHGAVLGAWNGARQQPTVCLLAV